MFALIDKKYYHINMTDQILSYQVINNSLGAYIWAASIFVVSFLTLKTVKRIVIGKLSKKDGVCKLVAKLIKSIGWFFYFFLPLYFAIQFIQLTPGLDKSVSYITLIIVAYYTVKILQAILDYSSEKIVQKGREEKNDYSIVKLINKVIKMVIWIVAVLIVLQNFGYNVSSLLAGVGIGGIAIAVALQNVLSDVFAAFSIYFDKPFQVGDFIILGDDMGTVKNIGIKSTRLKTLQGQELVVPNKELTETRVHNYKRMEKRRVVFGFGVIYDTPAEKLKAIPEMVKNVFTGMENVEADRVHFVKFSDSSLDFEVVYHIKSSDYDFYMDTQQTINLAIKEKFDQEKIEMAFPTQTVYVKKIVDKLK